jgi:probable rRNA maturation factor
VTLIEVDVVKAVGAPVPPAFIRKVIRNAARVPELAARLPSGRPSVAVRLTGEEEVRGLHARYAAEDTATDVLSFEGSGDHVGDIAISWPAVSKQAREHRHTVESELALLCVHGFLHLLGWDHATAPENREMTRLTLAALSISGIKLSARRL